MKYLNPSALIVGLLGCAALLGSAQAASVAGQSSGSISGLTYRLEDLAPNDGVKPWVTFSASVGMWNNPDTGQTTSTSMAGSPFASSSASFHGASVTPTSLSATSSYEQLALPPREQWASDHSVSGTGGGSSSAYITGTDPWSFNGALINLSPNTRLVIEGQAHAYSEATASIALGPQDTATINGLNVDYLYSVLAWTTTQGTITAGGAGMTGSSWYGYNDAFSVLGKTDADFQTGQLMSNTFDRPFILTLTNTGANSGTALLDMGTQTRVVSFFMASGVPEPGTWALMALGLGLMAWRVRSAREGARA